MTAEPIRYTMLPVQEDLVEDAMETLVRWMREDQLTDWHATAIDDLYEELDDNGRRFLTELARAALAGEPAHQDDLARTLGLTERELLGLVGEVSGLASAAGHTKPVLVYQAVVTGPDGELAERPTVIMEQDVATLIGAALGLGGPSSPGSPAPS